MEKTMRGLRDLPGHMVAALFEFNHSFTPAAPLPAFMFGLLQEFFCLLVVGAIPRRMPLAVAQSAYLGLAVTTLGNLASVLAVNVLRFYPFTTTSCWTVNAVPC